MPSYLDTRHLLSRTGFGAPHSEIEAVQGKSWPQAVNDIVDATPTPLAPDPSIPNSWDAYNDMTNYWLDRARERPNQLSEKIVLFWHGTLCSSLYKVGRHESMFDQNQILRRKGLGKFEDLILDVSLDPAMLVYLDNFRNHAGSPNENFSRELMELFTVGVGQYSEEDVKESARAWTGETISSDYQYVFKPSLHDGGSKTFLGRTGNLRGHDVIKELLYGRTADAHSKFVARKLWSFFAYPNPGDRVVSDIASTYRSSGLNIREAVRAILMHPEFLSPQAKQGIVRGPIEYAVASFRHAKFQFSVQRPLWMLDDMGQEPYAPPNVSGWHQNEAWLTESAIWAKGRFVNNIKWKVMDRGDTPSTDGQSDAAVVNACLNYLDVGEISNELRTILTDFAQSESNPYHKKSGIIYLTLLSPEMAVA